MIRGYNHKDAIALFDLLQEEGGEWDSYTDSQNWPKYQKALTSGVTYLFFEGPHLLGYVRCREDDGFGVYVYDLLVRRSERGKNIGKALLSYVKEVYHDQAVYVMSDVDQYYEKLGFHKEGSIFRL